ncbi:MAG: DNA polymerase [Candidatus Paceibacterota bacterium]|jgi:DNA polymerase-1
MKVSSTQTKKRLVLLDAHAILHRAYHALPDFATAKGEPTGALYGLSTMLIKIVEDLKPDYVVACYDVKGPTYRHEAYKEYKAGRQAAKDDLIAQMKRSRDVFSAMNIPIYDKEGFEADDMLGTIVEQLKDRIGEKGDLEIIIASGDMDTLQLVKGKGVQVYTLKKGIKDTIMYDEKAVLERFGFGPELIPDYKGLRGDPSDNIIGVKGIGEKTATILITTFGSVENMYKVLESNGEDKFKAVGITPRIIQLLKDNKEEAEFSKMLATIRRDSPITFTFPEKTFKDNLDIKKVSTLWHELEFRTLTQRLEKVVGGAVIPAKAGIQDVTNESVPGGNILDSRLRGNDTENHKDSPKEFDGFSEVSLALWLINSTITNPKIEDILNFTETEDYEESKKAIFAELDKRNLRKVYETIELPLIPVIKKMEDRGVKIDRAMLKNLSETYHVELAKLEKKIHEFAGTEFNINSPKQLGEILFDKLQLTAKNMKKTSGGARSTRESELEKLRDLHPIVPLLFEYRELQKLLSTYIDAIPPLLDDKDRLHSNFISSGSTTGRMASQNPNLQNIPIKSDLGKAIRNAFVAEKGFKLCGFDYSQMELRIAAFLSGDEKLIEIFRKGEDVHTSVASFVFKVPQNEVTATMRRQAKVINFGIIYGMGVMALKQNLGTTRDEAQKFLNDYFETFSTLANYLNDVKSETGRRGYTETFYGRRRYFEGINSKIPYIKASAERMAINAPIQGTEADVIKLAMIEIDKFIVKNRLEDIVFPLLQVHDELIYEIREDKAGEIAPQIEKIMEAIMDPKDTKGIVLKATANIGDNWGELK